MLAGVGIDILDVGRMQRELARDGGGMRDGVFTASEPGASPRPRQPGQHLASRCCAKEALLQALGTGWSPGVTRQDVDLRRDAAGRFGELLPSGEARDEADRLGVRHIWSDTTCSDGAAGAGPVVEQAT